MNKSINNRNGVTHYAGWRSIFIVGLVIVFGVMIIGFTAKAAWQFCSEILGVNEEFEKDERGVRYYKGFQPSWNNEYIGRHKFLIPRLATDIKELNNAGFGDGSTYIKCKVSVEGFMEFMRAQGYEPQNIAMPYDFARKNKEFFCDLFDDQGDVRIGSFLFCEPNINESRFPANSYVGLMFDKEMEMLFVIYYH